MTSLLSYTLSRLTLGPSCRNNKFSELSKIVVRSKCRNITLPPNSGPTSGKYRRKVHYPEEYTVKPLNITRLGGRDPETGRLVIKGIGGGIKRKYHWIEWKREGPKEGPPIVEKVIQIMDDWCRTSKIALVARGDKMKYILATENMKAGDLIKTSQHIPRIPVLAKEGDAYPLGALQNGTVVSNVEKYAGMGGWYAHSAGSFATILRKLGERVVIQLPSKQEVSLSQECMATVGRVSNIEHNKTPIGSAQRNRELGNRPRSGLWQRKDGRHGRKIRPLPPVQVFERKDNLQSPEVIDLSIKLDLLYRTKL